MSDFYEASASVPISQLRSMIEACVGSERSTLLSGILCRLDKTDLHALIAEHIGSEASINLVHSFLSETYSAPTRAMTAFMLLERIERDLHKALLESEFTAEVRRSAPKWGGRYYIHGTLLDPMLPAEERVLATAFDDAGAKDEAPEESESAVA